MNKESIKQIIRQIFEEEKKVHNLKGEFYPITVIEFYKDYMNKLLGSGISNGGLALVTLPLYSSAFNLIDGLENENTIYLFLKQSEIFKRNSKNLYDMLMACYHEIYHSIQRSFDEYSYDGFLYNMDLFLRIASQKDYFAEHSKYSFEIGANLYGITKAKEYLKNNYPELYEKEKEVIEKKEQQVKFYYQTYDLADTIERLLIQKKELGKRDNSDLNGISPILTIFLNDDFSFKNISEIIRNEKFKTLDKRIIYAFFSNKTFLETIDFEKLNEEELKFVQESLQYTNTLYQKQLEILSKEKKINLIDFLKVEKNIILKYDLLCNYIEKNIRHKLNNKRDDVNKREHMESISGHLEHANDLIRRKTRGYMTINIFYIIGVILSILTVGYILIRN